MSELPGGTYRVACPQAILEQLRTWGRQAVQRGHKESFLAALRIINQKLTTEPALWGDPQYELKQLHLPVHHALTGFLQLWYVVDEARRIVHVKEFRLLPWSPLKQS